MSEKRKKVNKKKWIDIATKQPVSDEHYAKLADKLYDFSHYAPSDIKVKGIGDRLSLLEGILMLKVTDALDHVDKAKLKSNKKRAAYIVGYLSECLILRKD